LVAAWVLSSSAGTVLVTWITVPLLAAVLAGTLEMARVHRVNLEFAQESHEAIEELAKQEATARREILELHQRQRDWTRLMEQQIAERTRTFEEFVSSLRASQEERVITLRGFSHDMRNPLTLLNSIDALVMRMEDASQEEWRSLKEDHHAAVEQLNNMVRELAETFAPENGIIKMAPEPIKVEPLAERLRRRMRAMVFGRDIQVSVFATREAPEAIVIDPVIFDRIMDNLMTNAAKYTDDGSIIIELDGTPGYLVIKISDTGRGIDDTRIDNIFEAPDWNVKNRPRESWGVGLSVVVRLLADIGGRLEVMSKPDVGTTFWVYLPCESVVRDEQSMPAALRDQQPDLVNRIVTIRMRNNK
jgi:signal transduction histidine kinase